MSSHDDPAITERITWTEEVHYTVRSYYSIGWLTAAIVMRDHARHFAERNSRLEPAEFAAMRSYVLCAMTAAAAFLEAHINELYDDASSYADHPGHEALRGLRAETQARLASRWPEVKRSPVLKKYALALRLAEAAPLESGSEPSESASLLLRLRNHYLHYQPDSVRDGRAQGDDRDLSAELHGKLTLPAWDTGTEDLLPSRALCPDLARWAVDAALRFADAFNAALQIAPGYEHVRPDR